MIEAEVWPEEDFQCSSLKAFENRVLAHWKASGEPIKYRVLTSYLTRICQKRRKALEDFWVEYDRRGSSKVERFYMKTGGYMLLPKGVLTDWSEEMRLQLFNDGIDYLKALSRGG